MDATLVRKARVLWCISLFGQYAHSLFFEAAANKYEEKSTSKYEGQPVLTLLDLPL